MNPNHIPDGHCAMCAFKTIMHFSGRKLMEAEEVNSDAFRLFSYWFYKQFSPEQIAAEKTVEGEKGESFSQFKARIEENIKAVTNAGEAVLISIGEGAHWITAFNSGKRVWFIDSQTGKGFNLYRDENNYKDVNDEIVDIVKVSSEKIGEYERDVLRNSLGQAKS